MLYSNIDEAYDNPMELQYNRYKNNMFSPASESEQDSVSTLDKDYTLLDKKTSQEMKDRFFSAQGDVKTDNLRGTTIDELREKSNKYSPNSLQAANYDEESKSDFDIVFKEKPKSHNYYVSKFIKDIEKSDDMSVNTGGVVYTHVRECSKCKDAVKKYFDKKNNQNTKLKKAKPDKKNGSLMPWNSLDNDDHLNTVVMSVIIGVVVILFLNFSVRFMNIIKR